MAADANTWLPEPVVRDTLSIGIADDSQHVIRCRDAAVALAARISGRPLTGRDVRILMPAPSTGNAVDLPPLRDIERVVRVGYWDSIYTSGVESTDTGDLGRLVQVAESIPKSAARMVAPAEGEPVSWRLHPPAGGWPATAEILDITVALAVNPVEWPDLVQACLILTRVYYRGKAALTADERRGLELMLPGMERWLNR